MLKIGVQSKGILDPEICDLEDGFRKISAAGFDCVDLNLDVFLKNHELYEGELNPFFDKSEAKLKEYFRPYLDGCRRYGLKFSQMHAPYPVWVHKKDRQNAYVAREVVPKSLMIAGFLGIPYVVIHPFKMQYLTSCEEERRRNLEYFKSLIPLARENRVVICLENLYESVGGRLVEGVCARPEEAIFYIDCLNDAAGEERFGFCLDTGHLNFVRRSPYEMIEKLGGRLKILHLHENDGEEDLHQIPYTFGDGKEKGFDWDEVFRGLRASGFDGVLSFETFPSMNSFPDGIKGTVLETIAQIARYFSEQIDGGQIAEGWREAAGRQGKDSGCK